MINKELKESNFFANVLAYKLKEKFPNKKFRVKYRKIKGKGEDDNTILSGIEEIARKGLLGLVEEKKRLALVWAGKLPTLYRFGDIKPRPEANCRNGIILYPTDLRYVIDEEVQKLNQAGNTNTEIFYSEDPLSHGLFI